MSPFSETTVLCFIKFPFLYYLHNKWTPVIALLLGNELRANKLIPSNAPVNTGALFQ